jgi:acetyl/propionyl-CoA carboxylase alpha subunit
MFDAILIANRGEIARRIQRTARRLGVRTCAVFAEADRGAAFVREADQAVCIGEGGAAQTYLQGQRIIDAALRTGAQAIHPGYGFLSENPEFAEQCAAAGLVFIGPGPAAIRAMGLKDASKRLMAASGVPVTPGYHGDAQDERTLLDAAQGIGFPVLIKAVAGGGGRGMRRVDSAADFSRALASARRESADAFGDDRVLVEKYVAAPRHIEVQILGDSHGSIVHLFERECTLQRRRQKVVEEAPAPGISPAVREALTRAAVEAARAVNYVNAGTVEFIADGTGELRADGFWFMEMNTRLQVEHPVTECVTGFDLVELQLDIACGGRVPAQSDINLRGHAVEARICAEDPAAEFRPSSGRMDRFRIPSLRVDSALDEGDEVSPLFDSMIAKAVSHAHSRSAALAALGEELEASQIGPLATNTAMLVRLLRHEAVIAGRVTTHFIEDNLEALSTADSRERAVLLAAAGEAWRLLQSSGSADPWSVIDGFRLNRPASIDPRRRFEGVEGVAVRLFPAAHGSVFRTDGADAFQGTVSGRFATEQRLEVTVRIDEQRRSIIAEQIGDDLFVFGGGGAFAFVPSVAAVAGDAVAAGDEVVSPMPGRVLEVQATAGDHVEKGQVLVVMEAMKMEYSLRSPRAGIVAEVTIVSGEQTREGVCLVRLHPADGAVVGMAP